MSPYARTYFLQNVVECRGAGVVGRSLNRNFLVLTSHYIKSEVDRHRFKKYVGDN
jgi:hypothetical protein